MQLTLLSALARREIDAWEFAARLQVEPAQKRISEMSALIAALPSGMPPQEPKDLIVHRLLALLPCDPPVARVWRAGATAEPARPPNRVGSLELIIGGVCFAIISFWVFGGLFEAVPLAAKTAATPPASVAATTAAAPAAIEPPGAIEPPLSAGVTP